CARWTLRSYYFDYW
nr:immunoglobulin heavy chain junction region [Mus musculus]